MNLGIVDKMVAVGSQVGGTFKSLEFIRESVNEEEAHLIDAAIASSVSTNRVENMLCTQSAGAGPSTLPECFEGTREPQPARPFAGFSPTVNQESRILVAGKFCSGTMLVGGPLPPLEEDDKEDMGEVEGPIVLMPDYAVLYRDDLYLMEGNPWADAKNLEANPWAVPKDLTVMVVEVPDVQMGDAEKGKEKEKSPASDFSNWYF